jgi:hypothetical protein
MMQGTSRQTAMSPQNYWASVMFKHDTNPNQTLSDRIIDRYVKSTFDPEDKQFLPEGCLQELVTVDTIIEELRDNYPGSQDVNREDPTIQRLVRFILEKAMKVFATTVVSGYRGGHLGYSMFECMKMDFTDDSLPVTYDDIVKRFGDKWAKTMIHNFFTEQWRFLVPVFSNENIKIDLKPNHILPFIERVSFGKEGAFGQVFRVQVHPRHQIDPVLDVSPLTMFYCMSVR